MAAETQEAPPLLVAEAVQPTAFKSKTFEDLDVKDQIERLKYQVKDNVRDIAQLRDGFEKLQQHKHLGVDQQVVTTTIYLNHAVQGYDRLD